MSVSVGLTPGRTFEATTNFPADDDLCRWADGLSSLASVQGSWHSALLRMLVAAWLGPRARIERFSLRVPGSGLVEASLHLGAEVSEVTTTADGSARVRCGLWARSAGGQVVVEGDCEALIDPAGGPGLPIARLEAALRLGEVAGTFTYRIGLNDLEGFAAAIGAPMPSDGVAPPTYFGALDPVERRDIDLDAFLHDLPFPMTGGGNAFNAVEYERPFRAGDVITVRTRYTDVYEKRGSRGTLLFRVRVNEMRDADGALVATSRCGHVLGYRLPSEDS